MAFPTTGILDNFNRTDSANLGANWNQPWGSTAIASNATSSANADEYASAFWNNATYTDVEVYYKITQKGNYADGRLFFRLNNMADDSTTNGYTVVWTGTYLQITRYELGSETNLGSSISQTIADGGIVGVSMVGTLITVYYNGSSVGSYDTSGDATKYSSAGYIGLNTYRATGTTIIDDFGGGTVVAGETFLTGVHFYDF
jgi:hypothetical protein